MLRTILSVVVGYLALAIFVVVCNAGLAFLFGLNPTAEGMDPMSLPMGYTVGTVITGFLAAIVGGWICARIAAHSPRQHGLYLAIFVLALGLVFAITTWGMQPAWIALLMPVVGFVGVRLGAGLRASAQEG